jgi:hypothetical protein
MDAPSVRIFCYALNDDGKRHWAPGHDRDACGVAREEPRDVLLDELPPPELRA